MKKVLCIVVGIAFVMSSCSKNNCRTDVAGLSGAYKIISVKYKPNGSSQEIDYIDTYFPQACLKDNLYTLNADNTYTVIDAGVSCGTNPYIGDWDVNGNTLFLDADDYSITSFNCETLVITEADYGTQGGILTITLDRQ